MDLMFRTLKKSFVLPQNERTFGHILKENGYKNLSNNLSQLAKREGQRPDEAGFDEYLIWNMIHLFTIVREWVSI